MNKGQILERLYQQNIEVQDLLEDRGLIFGEHYWIESVNLQGSQNYGTNHKGSDVDSKIIIVPTVETMLRGINLTADYSVSRNEKVGVKTFPEFVNLFFKGNVNNLEMLYTDYVVGNGLLDKVKPFREEIVQATMRTVTDAVVGMMVQKKKSLHKGTETTAPLVEKFGYDPKDALHIYRLFCLITDLQHTSFGDALVLKDDERNTAREVREGKYELEFINQWTSDMIDCVKNSAKLSFCRNDNEKIAELRAILSKTNQERSGDDC